MCVDAPDSFPLLIGTYTFHFSDNLYGAYLTVKTELRELNETLDAPLQEDGHFSYVLNESAENGRGRRGQRRRQRTASDEEDANLEWQDHDSDDSFIVNDDDDEEVAAGAFSNDEDDEGAWEFHSDDEEAEEASAQRRRAKRQRYNQRRAGRERARAEQRTRRIHDMTRSDGSGNEGNGDEETGNDPELVSQDTDGHEHQVEENEGEEEARHHHNPSARRRNKSNRVVIDSDDDENEEESEQKHSEEGNDVQGPEGHRNVIQSEKTDVFPKASGNEGIASGAVNRRSIGDDANEESKENATEDREPPPSPQAGNVGKSNDTSPHGTVFNQGESGQEAQRSDTNASQSSETEVTLRLPKRTRTRNVILSDEESGDEDDEEKDERPTGKRRKTTHRVQFDDDEEGGDEDDEAKFERMHPFYDEEREELHETEDAMADEDEERNGDFGFGNYDDEEAEGTFSDNDDAYREDHFDDSDGGDDDGGSNGWD